MTTRPATSHSVLGPILDFRCREVSSAHHGFLVAVSMIDWPAPSVSPLGKR